MGIERDQPARVDFADVIDVDGDIRLRITIEATRVGAIDQRLRRWLAKLPGSR